MSKFLAIILVFIASAAFSAEGSWGIYFQPALKKAEKENKFVLADFTGSDWCGWCKKLDKEVFSTKEFKEWAAANVVLVKLDFPHHRKLDATSEKQNNELAQKYDVKGFPTVLLLKPDGTVIGKLGYQEGGPKPWTEAADEFIEKAKAK